MSSAVAVADVCESSVPPQVERRLIRQLPASVFWGWALPLLVTAAAAAMRFAYLSRPKSKVFDEVYYAHDSWNLLHHGVELDSSKHDHAPGFVVHPPLGKWMIAVGEGIFGNNSLGWRFSAAVIGTLSVLLIARIARRLFRSTAMGCVAGLLLTLDGLEFVQSRTSMLDIFLMFWVLAAFGALVIDRDDGRARLLRRLPDDLSGLAAGPFLGFRPWRWVCGFCLGAATATKWDGIFWLPVFLLLAIWWDAGARRVAGVRRPVRAALIRDGLLALVPFLVVPALVYVVSWTGWFVSDGAHAWDHDRYVHSGQGWLAHDWAVIRGWLSYQREIYNFHAHLSSAHPYLSNPWGWLLLARPVAYFYAAPKHCGASTSCSQEVLGIGTPAIWWLSIPALVAVAWRMIGRFDWRAAAILLSFVAGYLSWIIDEAQTVSGCHPAADCHRTMFLFYLLPDVPFMVLALTMAIGMVLGRRLAGTVRRTIGALTAAAYLSGVVWNFGYFYPVLSAQVITYQQWHDRMWLDTCNNDSKRDQHVESAPCWI